MTIYPNFRKEVSNFFTQKQVKYIELETNLEELESGITTKEFKSIETISSRNLRQSVNMSIMFCKHLAEYYGHLAEKSNKLIPELLTNKIDKYYIRPNNNLNPIDSREINKTINQIAITYSIDPINGFGTKYPVSSTYLKKLNKQLDIHTKKILTTKLEELSKQNDKQII